jgi:Spx/MgsR family transcriptional regulator
MLNVYGIKNCNSMKKAFDLLNELGLAYEFHDYKKQGIDATTVKTWLDQIGADVVLNKKGTTWRKLTEAEQDTALASEQGLIDALTTHHSLIKRPVIATPMVLLWVSMKMQFVPKGITKQKSRAIARLFCWMRLVRANPSLVTAKCSHANITTKL